MVLEIEYSRLQKWIKNFEDNIKNRDIDFYTLSANIGFNDSTRLPNGENLKVFTAKMKKVKANGFRLYFIRYDEDKGDGKYPEEGRKPPVYFNGLSQVSIAMVPTLNGAEVKTGRKKDKVWVLVPGGETSGLCPVDCGNS